MRRATIDRNTKETRIEGALTIEGRGSYDIFTGIRFFDHMLELFAKHGGFDLKLHAQGDLDVDQHHTVEDVGIVLGQLFSKALGDRRGINRAGYFVLPMDETEAKLRNPRSGSIDYVPPGSIAKGEALATGKDEKTIRCAICHGQDLAGLGEVPPIVGRTGTYTFRQLNDMQSGARKGPWVELMKGVVANLTQIDMIALAAYLESRSP